MFPLLPALILMLLQGPSNFERLAVDGRLPATLEAIHRHFATSGTENMSERDEQALATLIAAGGSAELTRALMSFLWAGKQKPEAIKQESPEQVALVRFFGSSPPPRDGFEQSQRTRDGPAISGVAI